MKPDWKDAPEWAQWLAMDDDGEWFWHELDPYLENGEWLYGGKFMRASFADRTPIKEPRP